MTIRPVRQRQRPIAPTSISTVTETPEPAAPTQSVVAVGAPMETRPYEVGYRKPPVHTRFKPGQSGNPRGRPRQAKGLKTLAREILTEKVAVRTATGEKKISRIEVAIQKTAELALKGNSKALGEILKLYSAAVPDVVESSSVGVAEDLTETDLAVLEALKLQILRGEGTGA